MRIELYQQVALRRDVSEHGLRRGDVATPVDYAPHPQGGEAGWVLEVINVLGDSPAGVVVPGSAVEPLRSAAVLAVRGLSEAA